LRYELQQLGVSLNITWDTYYAEVIEPRFILEKTEPIISFPSLDLDELEPEDKENFLFTKFMGIISHLQQLMSFSRNNRMLKSKEAIERMMKIIKQEYAYLELKIIFSSENV